MTDNISLWELFTAERELERKYFKVNYLIGTSKSYEKMAKNFILTVIQTLHPTEPIVKISIRSKTHFSAHGSR